MSSLLLMASFCCVQWTGGQTNTQEKIVEMVDIIELNHCYDFRGQLAFRQLIFYRWSAYHRRFQVVDTVVVTQESMVPRKSVSGIYQSRWKDDEGHRVVKSMTCRHSRSNADPEVKEREYLPSHLRQGLKVVRKGENKKAELNSRMAQLPPKPEKLLKY